LPDFSPSPVIHLVAKVVNLDVQLPESHGDQFAIGMNFCVWSGSDCIHHQVPLPGEPVA
jgi:hypothetical protein